MTCFVDWTCKKCGRRFGKRFESMDDLKRPPCPQCGDTPSKRAKEDMEMLRKLLDPFPMTPDGYFKARRASGLSIGQAAQLMKVPKEKIAEIEDGTTQPYPKLLKRMRDIYRCKFVEEE